MAKRLNSSRKPTKAKLGMGMDALFVSKRLDKPQQLNRAVAEAPEETVQALSKQFMILPIDKISRNPDQPRTDFEEKPLQELADSIRHHGIIQPMTVRHMGDGTYQIISGERRFRASKLAGLTEVPAFIRTVNDQTLLEMALIENIQREDLNPMEVAYSYFRLKQDFNMTQSDVAERVGKPRTTVAGYLGILNTSTKVQDAIKNKDISIGIAKTFAGLKDVGLQELFLEEILANPGWSVREVEKRVKNYKPKAKKASSAGKAIADGDDLKVVRTALQEFFGTKQVKIVLEDKATKAGSFTIKFGSQEELEEMYKSVRLDR